MPLFAPNPKALPLQRIASWLYGHTPRSRHRKYLLLGCAMLFASVTATGSALVFSADQDHRASALSGTDTLDKTTAQAGPQPPPG